MAASHDPDLDPDCSDTGTPSRRRRSIKWRPPWELSSAMALRYGRAAARPRKWRHDAALAIAKPEMGYFCFDVLRSFLFRLEPPSVPQFSNDPYPLFVTWQTYKDKVLRGCIGTFSDTQLHEGLREYAVTSAMRDSRFSPVSPDELPRLQVAVSILCHFEDASDFLDWDVGIHGIRIDFVDKGSKKTATYLPEVPKEQGWDKVETVDNLLRKGGFKGDISDKVRSTVRLVRYKSEKIIVAYTEYLHHCRQRSQGEH